MNKEVKKALAALEKWGATIKHIGNDQYLVKNEGQFGLLSEDDFIVSGDEVIEMADQYAK
jgi:hypothetical protein